MTRRFLENIYNFCYLTKYYIDTYFVRQQKKTACMFIFFEILRGNINFSPKFLIQLIITRQYKLRNFLFM